MVYRIYTERKNGFASEAVTLLNELRTIMEISGIDKIRVINRYDVEDIAPALFEKCKTLVFSEPQTDMLADKMPEDADAVFAVEYLPGQYDQRADSCSQCIQFVSGGSRPVVKTAKVYLLYGNITGTDIERLKKYIINPVESREASLEEAVTLKTEYPEPENVKILNGFILASDNEAAGYINEYALAMDRDDILFCRDYFKKEDRDPTLTELRMIDTYWSDHCRHTTFSTILDNIDIGDIYVRSSYDRYLSLRAELDSKKNITLMDIATIGAKYLKKNGMLENLDESDEINACTVKIKVNTETGTEDWLLLFKNETHNHPTEIEPFGGAATCLGGAIRDPLSGRGYVYQAMRVTGAGDPTLPISETIKGKLPQRKIVTTAANGYSSYGNQIGLATGLVDEIYHPGYIAKRMEIGAVIGAVPLGNVRREKPAPGDLIILLGGKTGRDGCGGATGSSKSHDIKSLESCGAEVQKGNPPEERKIQRLFRNPKASLLIKKCNDFGAGGVSVAIGELADGLIIDLDKVPKKYEGLDGTELAISESQERMAVVVGKEDSEKFKELAAAENLEATVVAEVTESNRLVMLWRGSKITDLDREFLNSNGAEKHADVCVTASVTEKQLTLKTFEERFEEMCSDLNICSKQGLSERFDSTIGAGSVLMPFGGRYQLTPTQVMAAKIPVVKGETNTCSVFSYGYNPYISEKSQYLGAYLAVVESLSKIIAAGSGLDNCYLSFQEYFERLRKEPSRWGKPFASLLGALDAQLDFGVAAIGGKDSMSGTFEDIDVPPTLVSFAAAVSETENIISPEFKKAGNKIIYIAPEYDENGKPDAGSQKKVFSMVHELIAAKKAVSVYTCVFGGIMEALFKMSLGNKIGYELNGAIASDRLFDTACGSFVLEVEDGTEYGMEIGKTTGDFIMRTAGLEVRLDEYLDKYNQRLNSVFPRLAQDNIEKVEKADFITEKRTAPSVRINGARVLIPVFPGTNCEYDTARAFERSGGKADIFVIKNQDQLQLEESVSVFAGKIKDSQIIFIPGGFSGGDEPDGSGKFINAFFRNEFIKEAVHELLKCRDGLIGGICNGFQALIKLGLVPFGEITDIDESNPTLTYNTISRHVSKIVRTRIASNKSPWLSPANAGDIHFVPVSHGEGRIICRDDLYRELLANGQIATQYVDLDGNPTMDPEFNPNGSYMAVEGLTSPDGRVFGKMGHSERTGDGLYKNVQGNYNNFMFKNAIEYFK